MGQATSENVVNEFGCWDLDMGREGARIELDRVRIDVPDHFAEQKRIPSCRVLQRSGVLDERANRFRRRDRSNKRVDFAEVEPIKVHLIRHPGPRKTVDHLAADRVDLVVSIGDNRHHLLEVAVAKQVAK